MEWKKCIRGLGVWIFLRFSSIWYFSLIQNWNEVDFKKRKKVDWNRINKTNTNAVMSILYITFYCNFCDSSNDQFNILFKISGFYLVCSWMNLMWLCQIVNLFDWNVSNVMVDWFFFYFLRSSWETIDSIHLLLGIVLYVYRSDNLVDANSI